MDTTLENINTKLEREFDATLSECYIKAQAAPVHSVHLQFHLHKMNWVFRQIENHLHYSWHM